MLVRWPEARVCQTNHRSTPREGTTTTTRGPQRAGIRRAALPRARPIRRQEQQCPPVLALGVPLAEINAWRAEPQQFLRFLPLEPRAAAHTAHGREHMLTGDICSMPIRVPNHFHRHHPQASRPSDAAIASSLSCRQGVMNDKTQREHKWSAFGCIATKLFYRRAS
jgi:hypothetical protein